jgi:hypothetical protein
VPSPDLNKQNITSHGKQAAHNTAANDHKNEPITYQLHAPNIEQFCPLDKRQLDFNGNGFGSFINSLQMNEKGKLNLQELLKWGISNSTASEDPTVNKPDLEKLVGIRGINQFVPMKFTQYRMHQLN